MSEFEQEVRQLLEYAEVHRLENDAPYVLENYGPYGIVAEAEAIIAHTPEYRLSLPSRFQKLCAYIGGVTETKNNSGQQMVCCAGLNFSCAILLAPEA